MSVRVNRLSTQEKHDKPRRWLPTVPAMLKAIAHGVHY